MGVSYYVLGIKPADEKFRQMKAAYHACEKAGVKIPKEIYDFFNGDRPNEKGVQVYLDSDGPFVSVDGDDDFRLTVDLEKLPKDIKILQFVVSY